MQLIFIIIFISILVFLLNGIRSKPKQPSSALPGNYKILLEQNVAFYRALSDEQKKKFGGRMAAFLSSVTIEGIRTTIDDIDKVFIAASAVIPMFGFTAWQYHNLNSVLLYPEHFNEAFDLDGEERRVMGMVGDGAMNNTMILSQPALREGFKNETDKNNTAIHEFVHLLDKMDGDTDGIPQVLLDKQYTIPWINQMHKEIDAIIKNRSDINPYGASSKTEFFAVASEYFFERPSLFKERHPELYKLMEEIFDQTPAIKAKATADKIGRNDPCPCGSGEKYKECHGK
ncbi:MAG: zinc-dependent peptidase [Bacteroidota bacterium]